MDQVQSISQTTGQELHPNTSSKLPLILVGFLLILSAGVGGVYLGKYLYAPKTPVPIAEPTATPTLPAEALTKGGNPTANWKMYTSSDLGLSLKYPQNFRVSEDYTAGTGLVDFGILLDLNQAGGTPDRTMFITNSEKHNYWNKQKLESLYNSGSEKIYTSDNSIQLQRQIDKTSNNQLWHVYEVVNPQERPKPVVYLVGLNGKKYYLVEMLYSNLNDVKPGNPEYGTDFVNTFDQILSTFRFTSLNANPTIVINDTFVCRDGRLAESSEKCSPPEVR